MKALQKFLATFLVLRFYILTLPLGLRNKQHFFEFALSDESLLEFCWFWEEKTEPSFLLLPLLLEFYSELEVESMYTSSM